MIITTEQMKNDVQETLDKYDTADLALMIIAGTSNGIRMESVVLDGSLKEIAMTIAMNMAEDESLEKTILCAASLYASERDKLKKILKERTKRV